MKETQKDILWRIYLVYIFICLFGIAIIAQVCRLQFVQGKFWREKADSLTLAYKKIEPVRGNIYSADGSLLATSVPIYNVHVDFLSDAITKEIFNNKVDSLAYCLSVLFKDKSKDEYKRFLKETRKEGNRYALLQRNVTFNQLKKLRQFPVFRLGRYKGGLIVEQKSRRERPFQLLAARTIGYNIPNVTPVGLEGSFDKYLKGVNGIRLMQKISGNVWKPLNDENEVDPKEGNDIITTIDVNIQDVAENSLLTQLQMHNAESGCAILMEVETGEIRAIANLRRGSDGFYREDFNSSIGQSTEPGSTFKLASMLAALEDGYVDLDDSVDTQKGVVYWTAGRPMKDSHDGGYGRISVKHAFEVSSNVGISKIINKYYSKNPQAFVDRLRKMHIGEPLGLQIEGEGMPLVKDTKNKSWSKTTLPYMSIGYECKLTPLQVLAIYNMVANNGTMVKPKFVKEIRQKGQLVKSYPVEIIADSICSPATIRKARELLEGVVLKGTATNLKNSEYQIAGKTGTARIANNNAGYENGGVKYQASFVGYFPADNPKYSCMVVVYAPSNDVYYAAQVAGPIFKEIADKVYSTNIEMHAELQADSNLAENNHPLIKPGFVNEANKVFAQLNIPGKPVEKENNLSVKTEKKSKVSTSKMEDKLVPNVIGMGLRDAIYLLENRGMQVTVTGRGAVVKQSLDAGIKINKGQQIIIELG
ncbi:MAG TPA: penicillin-binding protein [Bacteroidia bacterium]|nr:penicillin-binding protein [Bacteroidia bacterium]